VKLAYQDLSADGAVDVVVLHREATFSVDEAVGAVRDGGAARRIVVPYGDYGILRSGMELGGMAWYRHLPGYAGTDPISLAKAVIQVSDVIDDLAPGMPAPSLVGFGQGAVVAAGVGCLFGDKVAAVACFDAVPEHLDALPDGPAGSAPPVLVGATGPEHGDAVGGLTERLARRGATVTTWVFEGAGEPGPAVAERLGRWLTGGG